MANVTRQKQEDCKGKRAVVLEDLTENNSDAICVSRTHKGAKKVVCVDECEGHKKCAQLCMNHGEALDSTNRLVPSEVKLTEIFPGTFFVDDSLKKHHHGGENVILYPDWRCQDAVEIQENGSLWLMEKMNGRQVLKWVVGILT